jgi:hypothetical protein
MEKFDNKRGKSFKSSGIIQLLILIIIGIFLMSYFHITFKEFIDSFVTAWHNVFPS